MLYPFLWGVFITFSLLFRCSYRFFFRMDHQWPDIIIFPKGRIYFFKVGGIFPAKLLVGFSFCSSWRWLIGAFFTVNEKNYMYRERVGAGIPAYHDSLYYRSFTIRVKVVNTKMQMTVSVEICKDFTPEVGLKKLWIHY